MRKDLMLCGRSPRGLLLALGLSLAPLLALAADARAEQTRLQQALSAYEDGHFVAAARQLDAAAASGDLQALEVLALMNLYGTPMYGAGPWDKARGSALLQQAAEHGSEMAAALIHSRQRRATFAQTGSTATTTTAAR